ncbi:TPA: SulP family inorganic anion transporter [Candidatus Gastranaerophilales bacterium HUM_20]|nr:sulphate transporter [Clostridium sp. CAG:729]DAB19486.1 MAG TPA: SulP family inorganic anion transporter [Candidatus Gastranaerophilales bacterium HUM_20]
MDIKSRLNVVTGDILGGLNAAIITLPQALAFGVATGFGASAGIWGAIILCLIAGVLGTKVPMISGVTGPVAIVVASVMHALNKDMGSVIFIIFMAGIFQILLSLSKLPEVVKYVPYPVISGFMNGVGVIIIIMQLNPLLGLPPCSNTIESLECVYNSLHAVNIEAFAIGALTLLIVFLFPKKWNKYVPSQILALIICTLISIKTGLNIPRIDQISISLPAIVMPHTNLHDLITYMHYAVTLAVILSSESLLTGLVCTSITKVQLPPRRLLSAQGLGNMFCALTGSLPGSAATMRTVAALKTGASTRLAAVVTPLVLVLLLYKFSGFVADIPLAVLAGILIKIGYDIIDTKFLKVIKLAPKDDLYVLTLVFLLTVFYNLIVAVGAGVVLAALLYAKKVADNAKLVANEVYDKDIIKLEKMLEKDYKHKIRVVHINGAFFFGSATQLISQFDEFLGTRYLILVYDSESLLDISAMFALEDIILRLKSQHIKTLMVIKNQEVYNQLKNYNIVSQIGESRMFFDEIEAINHAKQSFKKRVKKKYFGKS